jgi:hypothetical protein
MAPATVRALGQVKDTTTSLASGLTGPKVLRSAVSLLYYSTMVPRYKGSGPGQPYAVAGPYRWVRLGTRWATFARFRTLADKLRQPLTA